MTRSFSDLYVDPNTVLASLADTDLAMFFDQSEPLDARKVKVVEWQVLRAAITQLSQGATVSTNQATGNVFPVDLSPVGPSVTVTILASGKVELVYGAQIYNNTANMFNLLGVDDGSGIVTDTQISSLGAGYPANLVLPAGRGPIIAAGYTPGASVTFTLKYGQDGSGGQAGYRSRWLYVRPI